MESQMPKLTTKVMSSTVKTAVIAWSAGIVIALAVAGGLTYAVPGQIYGNIDINDKIPGYNLPDKYTVGIGEKVSLEVHAGDNEAVSATAAEHIESINWAITPLNGISSNGVSKAEGNKKCSVVRKETECTTTKTTKCTKDKKGNFNCTIKIGGKNTKCNKVVRNNYPSYCDLKDIVTFSEPGTYKFEGFITTVKDLGGKKATEGSKYIVDSYDIKVTGDIGNTGGISINSDGKGFESSTSLGKNSVYVGDSFGFRVDAKSDKGLDKIIVDIEPAVTDEKTQVDCKGEKSCTLVIMIKYSKAGDFKIKSSASGNGMKNEISTDIKVLDKPASPIIKISKSTVGVNENFDITVTDNSGKMRFISWRLASSVPSGSNGIVYGRPYYYCKSGQVPCTATSTLSIPKTGVFNYCAFGAIESLNFIYGDCASVEVK